MSSISNRPSENARPAPGDELPFSVTRSVTFAKCLRCDFEWIPRVETPAKCPKCKSALWNVERAQKLAGKAAPTRKGKPRGRPLTSGDPRHSSNYAGNPRRANTIGSVSTRNSE